MLDSGDIDDQQLSCKSIISLHARPELARASALDHAASGWYSFLLLNSIIYPPISRALDIRPGLYRRSLIFLGWAGCCARGLPYCFFLGVQLGVTFGQRFGILFCFLSANDSLVRLVGGFRITISRDYQILMVFHLPF